MVEGMMTVHDSALAVYLIHLGFVAGAVAYLLRDILWLRIVALASYSIFFAAALSMGDQKSPAALAWYAIFVAINLAHASWLIYQRWLWDMTEEEQDLHALAFPALSRHAAKKLIGEGIWLDLDRGSFLTHERELASKIYVIAKGRAAVENCGRHLADLRPGQFVGEIGYVTNRPASASVIALGNDPEGGPTRVISWSSDRLRRCCRKDAGFESALSSALGADLARKIAAQNISPSGM